MNKSDILRSRHSVSAITTTGIDYAVDYTILLLCIDVFFYCLGKRIRDNTLYTLFDVVIEVSPLSITLCLWDKQT